jgi:sugar lactone lactonase YvrE
MGETLEIERVDPRAGVAGGEVVIECRNFESRRVLSGKVFIGGRRAWLVGSSPSRVVALIPETEEGGDTDVVLEDGDGARSAPSALTTGRKLAEDLHIVASPAVSPEDGSVFVTRSGSRGQHVPVSLYRIDTGGELHSLHGEITNPTGIAFDDRGQMYVTSRLDGTVYRVSAFREVVPFARDLGVATGLAFDQRGYLYVGDRQGTIHRVNEIGEAEEWARMEPSVSAYHMAFGPDGALYVTGPTVSSYDTVTRFDEHGRKSTFFRGLGRPQGLAFDRDGQLYVAASYRGRRGVVRIDREGRDARLVVAGMNVVGLAFTSDGAMVVATNEAVYSLPLGIRGTLV